MVTAASLIPTISVGKGAAGNPAGEAKPNRHANANAMPLENLPLK